MKLPHFIDRDGNGKVDALEFLGSKKEKLAPAIGEFLNEGGLDALIEALEPVAGAKYPKALEAAKIVAKTLKE